MKRPAQFLQQARATLILHIFGSLMAIIACLIVTVSGMFSSAAYHSRNWETELTL
jgi:hypothetical protein